MLQRQTQTAAFWRDQFETSPEDIDFLYAQLLEAQSPLPIETLAMALIAEYMRREESRLQQELAKGAIYQPKQRYAVGHKLVFPSLDFAVGNVTELRQGKNPEYGNFDVVRVEFSDGRASREYAAGLETPHRLNQGNGADLLGSANLLSAKEIYGLYKGEIEESVHYALDSGPRSDQFVDVVGRWLLSDALAEVHIGHLNIAEAMIEVAGAPQATEQLLAELDLDKNVPEPLRELSLEHALRKDGRFDLVGVAGKKCWFLRRLEPAEVTSTPHLLRHTPQRYNRSVLSVELLQYEWELDDEWGESTLPSEMPALVPNVSITIIYPHRKYGTLPLNGRTRSFFPSIKGAAGGLSLVTFVDGRWGTRFPGWVVHQGRFVAGLGKWYEDHAVPAGAFITLERGTVEGEIVVDFRTRRAKREWARVAMPNVDNATLGFEMAKVQVACEYDEQLIVADGGAPGADPETLNSLSRHFAAEQTPLATLVEQVVPELTKLNPQGTVHAKSVYAAVNMVMRVAPGPVFNALVSNHTFRDSGSGFFALA